MFTTTLRIPDALASYLQEAAAEASLSVHAFLTQVLERERAVARKRRLARDWTAYAADSARDPAQAVAYAFAAQAELVAEPAPTPYQTDGPPPALPGPDQGPGQGKGGSQS